MASSDNDLIMTGAVTTVVSGPGDVFSLQTLLQCYCYYNNYYYCCYYNYNCYNYYYCGYYCLCY